ncbi:MAG TPA: PEP-CTERM sorting domain-containing protein [Phycisphaerae bacterium]|nr:PEP-CTERM sorting domain-containing protein [Phycisphaerae bacterium]
MSRGILSLCVVACLMICSAASAGTIVQTQPFGPSTPNYQAALTFNQYDDSTYALDSVEVIFDLTIGGGQLILDNDGVDPAAGSFELGAQGVISSTDVTLLDAGFGHIPADLLVATGDTFNLAGNVGDGANDFDPSPPDGLAYTGVAGNDGSSGFVNPTLFGGGDTGYIGLGTFDVTAGLTQWVDYGSVGGIEYAVNPVDAEGFVTVIYNYTIPEPGTLALLGFGGLAVLRKRRS